MEGTKGQVNTEKRRVYLFIAVGLLAAAAVGYGVWRASTPSTPSASDIATATTEVSTNSDTAGQIVPTPVPEETGIATESAPQAQVPASTGDPYLPPNAVVQSAPTDIGPTVVYRPENIMDSPAAEPATAQPTPTPPGAGEVSGRPENTGTPTTAPTATTAPTEPEPEAPQTTTTPTRPDTDTPTTTPTEPAATVPETPVTAQTQAPAATTPRPAPAGSSRPN